MALNSQAQLAVVSKERHALKKWQRANGYSFAARQAVVPIVAAEMASASHAMPLAFVQDNDRFSLVGLLSVAPGTNLFVGPSGQWLGSYVPAAFRSYPFRMVRAEGSDGLMLAVDETSGVVVENDSPGEPFFDENGEATAAVQAVMQMLAALDAGRISTQRAVATLAQSDILEPWPLKLRAEEGEKELPGLYRVNEAGLAELSNESFLRLRGTGALPVAYAQLLSMTQVSLFPQLARIQAQLAPRPTPSPEVPENLDDVFGLAKDESIKFDF